MPEFKPRDLNPTSNNDIDKKLNKVVTENENI
jgi:hypothetical protein